MLPCETQRRLSLPSRSKKYGRVFLADWSGLVLVTGRDLQVESVSCPIIGRGGRRRGPSVS